MKTKILKFKTAAIKIAGKIWEKIGMFLVLFLILDLIIAGIFFLNHRARLSEERGPYLSLLINKGLSQQFFSNRIERAKEFQNMPDKEFRDLFREIAEETIEEKTEEKID